MSDPHNAVRLSALKSIQDEEYGKAVMSFLSLLTSKCPISKIENDLVYAMDLYVASLCQLNQHSKSRWLWAKTIEIADNKSIILLYSHARFLCTIGELSEALDNLQKCSVLDPSYAPAIETAENIKGLIVDRWHFRMLNDEERNLTYKRCIENAVALQGPNCTVLDIGGGTGLLSIYAVMVNRFLSTYLCIYAYMPMYICIYTCIVLYQCIHVKYVHK
jgi:type II protein arginine methyltransferase